MIRLRFTYEKTDALRYIGHLDLQKVWIRVLLRSKTPIAYTQGFHPAPKLGIGWPLPLGWEGKNELIDVWLDLSESEFDDVRAQHLTALLNQNSPYGLSVKDAKVVPLYSPSLTVLIRSAVYTISADSIDRQDFHKRFSELMASPEVMISRREKVFNLKAMIENAEMDESDPDELRLTVQMPAVESSMGRPDELVVALGIDPNECLFSRDYFIFGDQNKI